MHQVVAMFRVMAEVSFSFVSILFLSTSGNSCVVSAAGNNLSKKLEEFSINKLQATSSNVTKRPNKAISTSNSDQSEIEFGSEAAKFLKEESAAGHIVFDQNIYRKIKTILLRKPKKQCLALAAVEMRKAASRRSRRVMVKRLDANFPVNKTTPVFRVKTAWRRKQTRKAGKTPLQLSKNAAKMRCSREGRSRSFNTA